MGVMGGDHVGVMGGDHVGVMGGDHVGVMGGDHVGGDHVGALDADDHLNKLECSGEGVFTLDHTCREESVKRCNRQ